MSERKFARGLGKPGTAAQLRETVSQVVRESTVQFSVRNVMLRLLDCYVDDSKPSPGGTTRF
ncbi:hypothetical protein NQ317_010016 [Molorchus minor]|uniref:Uncharacterized protein n=1 Tax=Molorchus minor TaxID=1323400 RepID=A0ABQ9IT43_9CUCU|nr:hypothetical protein NQ317_010016 [Molorchus minor]